MLAAGHGVVVLVIDTRFCGDGACFDLVMAITAAMVKLLLALALGSGVNKHGHTMHQCAAELTSRPMRRNRPRGSDRRRAFDCRPTGTKSGSGFGDENVAGGSTTTLSLVASCGAGGDERMLDDRDKRGRERRRLGLGMGGSSFSQSS